MDDPFLTAASLPLDQRISPITGLPFSVSSPKVAQLFNIFHPSDPISYRLEPLISPAMSSLKPQVLPYTKKGIFGSVAPQGFSGIGMKVGQSVSQGVSGLWSSLSAGIANSLLNRSLGLSNEEVAKMNAASAAQPGPAPTSDGASAPTAAGTAFSNPAGQNEKANNRKRQLVESSPSDGSCPGGDKDVTLIDDELETLFSKFQKRRLDGPNHDESQNAEIDWAQEDRKAQKLRLEEMKVRALNRNGRVDYSIQE
jgi:hypothetical protein